MTLLTPDTVKTVVGVCLGHGTGAMVTATRVRGVSTAVDIRRYGPNLEPLASDVRGLLAEADDLTVIFVDRGLRGAELWDQIGVVDKNRLRPFDARAEDRRYRVAGKLTQALESGTAKIRRDLVDDEMRAELAATSREDAGDRPEVVALSLALQEPDIRRPRYGYAF